MLVKQAVPHPQPRMRNHVQHNKTLLIGGLVAEDDSDDSDSEEDDSDDPSRQQSPANGGASTSAAATARMPGEKKRDRPEDMQDEFVAVKRANMPLSSVLTMVDRSTTSSGRATPTSTEVFTQGITEGAQKHLEAPIAFVMLMAACKFTVVDAGEPLRDVASFMSLYRIVVEDCGVECRELFCLE
jgi:hypothetical protein